MPTERLSMRRIRDVLRLKYEARLSERAMVAALGISKGAIGSYLNRVRAAGLSWPLPEGLTDTELERRLFPGPPPVKLSPAGRVLWSPVAVEPRPFQPAQSRQASGAGLRALPPGEVLDELPGGIRVGAIFDASFEIGNRVRAVRESFVTR